MPTKKKPKLSFNVPKDVGSGRDSGWVYRSDSTASAGEAAPEPGAGAASSMSLAITAMVQMAALTMAVAAIPLTIGLRMLGAMADRDK